MILTTRQKNKGFPAFLKGIARVLDMGATFTTYKESSTPGMADYNAIKKDWEAVGKDLYGAISTFESRNLHG